MKVIERIPHRGYQSIGLGFWQAWWMIVLCSDAIIPDDFDAINLQLLVTVATTLGYPVVMVAHHFAPRLLNGRHVLPLTATVMSAGVFLLLVAPYVSDAALQLTTLAAGVVGASLGNALLLIKWGELWGELATGRVGRHLYLSYAFAFILYFVAIALPRPLGGLLTCLFPLFSCAILKSCENEPKRLPVQPALSWRSIPVVRLLLFVFLLSLLWGAAETLVPGLVAAGGASFSITASMIVAGVATGVFALSLIALSPEVEAVVMYQTIVPALACGMVLLALLPGQWSFLGNGIMTMGIYCSDMFVMLLFTDLAFRTRTPTVVAFGTGVVASRLGTLAGMMWAIGSGVNDLEHMSTLAVVCLGVLVFAGALVFTKADLLKLYEAPAPPASAAPPAPAPATTPGEQDGHSESPLEGPPEKGPQTSAPETPLARRCARVARNAGLTARETEVLELLVRGRTVQDVCDELSIAQGTAKHHVSNIYRKLGVGDRRSLYDIVEREEG